MRALVVLLIVAMGSGCGAPAGATDGQPPDPPPTAPGDAPDAGDASDAGGGEPDVPDAGTPPPVLKPVDVVVTNTAETEVRALVTVSSRTGAPMAVRELVTVPALGERSLEAFAMIPVGAAFEIHVLWDTRGDGSIETQTANGMRCVNDRDRPQVEYNICLPK